MTINHYSFGKITIDGKAYTSDVIIYGDRVDPSWWRQEGHRLQSVDLDAVINAKPDVIVIGTGYFGMMKVPDETIQFIKSKGIEVLIMRTGKAVEMFNSLSKDKKIIAALHITC